MKKLLIIAGVAGAIYYLSTRKAQAEERRLGPMRIGEIDVPPDADQDIITLQDMINLSEAWIMQAAGDMAARAAAGPLPGAHPTVDLFGGQCEYTGRLDPQTRLHLTKLKGMVWKTHLPMAIYEQLGLGRLMATDVGVENDIRTLQMAVTPIETSLMAIGGQGYPAVTSSNRADWAFYEAIGNAYLALLEQEAWRPPA